MIVPKSLADAADISTRRLARVRDRRHAHAAPRRRHRRPLDPGRRAGGDPGRLVRRAGRVRRHRCRLLRGQVRSPARNRRREPALDAAATSYALEPNQLDRVSGTVGDALDRIFRLLDALSLIAVLVAGLGMVNTFSMSVLERVREIGVLRATGMTSRQVWGMVVIEAGMLGLVGAIVGAAVGLLVGALLVAWSSAGFGFVFDPPWLSIASGRLLRLPDQPHRLDLPGRSGQPGLDRPGSPARVATECESFASRPCICSRLLHSTHRARRRAPVVTAPQPRRRRINDACSRPTR